LTSRNWRHVMFDVRSRPLVPSN